MEQGRAPGESILMRDGSESRDIPSVPVEMNKKLTLGSMDHDLNPFKAWATVVDCGDIANTPFDKLVAIHELEKGMKSMNALKAKNDSVADVTRFITIGGDHTISMNTIFYQFEAV